MCCTAKCCPLVTAWATTIHKFQGFEAGFDETDMFRRLIINPGSEKWEKDCPGAFYVSLSRAKTMGSRTSDTDFPKDSAIYWIGEGVNTNRIRQGAYKKRKKRSDPIRHCDAVIKRERWVQYLQHRKDLTTKRIYSKSELRDIKKKSSHSWNSPNAFPKWRPNQTKPGRHSRLKNTRCQKRTLVCTFNFPTCNISTSATLMRWSNWLFLFAIRNLLWIR